MGDILEALNKTIQDLDSQKQELSKQEQLDIAFRALVANLMQNYQVGFGGNGSRGIRNDKVAQVLIKTLIDEGANPKATWERVPVSAWSAVDVDPAFKELVEACWLEQELKKSLPVGLSKTKLSL